MLKSKAVTVSFAAAALGLATLSGASAAEHRGTPPHFRGPVEVGGLCRVDAQYYGSIRQDGHNVVATIHVRHAGVHTRWSLSSEVSTDFGDGSGVAGHGDGFARADANGHFTIKGATPLGVRHEFTFHLSRSDTGDRCFSRVKA
jgi:hypothetical protein